MWDFLQNPVLVFFLKFFGDQIIVDVAPQVDITVCAVFDARVALTVSPRSRELIIYWNHSGLKRGDRIVITDELVLGNRFDEYEQDQKRDSRQGSGDSKSGPSFHKYLGVFPAPDEPDVQFVDQKRSNLPFVNSPKKGVIYSMMLDHSTGWWKTNIKFDFGLTKSLTINSTCYAFWVNLIDENGSILSRNCLSAHPRWMNDLRDKIGDIKVRDLFIPGTHDSGSYKLGYDPASDKNLLDKYLITQDDDIRSQLLHGIRYIDLRIGYYRHQDEKFWANHGFKSYQPLSQILSAVKDFVLKTSEIVILDFQEFPVGFGQGLDVYRILVDYIHENMNQVLLKPPTASWGVSLNDVWKTSRNVIIGFDNPEIQLEFQDFLWEAAKHRWPNVQDVPSLVQYLRESREETDLTYSQSLVAEMAELTPKKLGIALDLYGGLRKMAENSNSRISELYSSEFGFKANVVAVDFHLSTTIVEAAIQINSLKSPSD